MKYPVNITLDGPLSLPAAIRKHLGIAGGRTLVIEVTPDGVILRTVAQSIASAQALARNYAGHSAASVNPMFHLPAIAAIPADVELARITGSMRAVTAQAGLLKQDAFQIRRIPPYTKPH